MPERTDIAQAASALSAGELVVLPTETLYGVAASAASMRAVNLLRDLISVYHGAPKTFTPATWHAPDSQAPVAALTVTHPTHRRLFDRLAPGPVRFIVPVEDAPTAAARLGALPGILESSAGEISVRVPSDPTAREVLAAVPGPVIIERISVLGWGPGVALPANARERASAMGIAAVLDAGPTRFGKPSTNIQLLRDGRYNVFAAGAYEERFVRKKMERTILFVCTGNTCRSPMAEAIARDLLAREGAPDRANVLSAGVTALPGAPMTPEAREVLTDMGVDHGHHRSRAVDAALVNSAEVIFAMTRSHLRAIESSGGSGKVHLLDPDGRDIPDPIGGPIEEYRDTAQRIRTMVIKRLEELGLLPPTAAARDPV